MSRTVVVVDAANVVGARADGWWSDRAGATRKLWESLLTADVPGDEIVLVLEGGAKAGVKAGKDAHLRVVHAPKDGDSKIVSEAKAAADKGAHVIVVSADRALRANVGSFAKTVGPTWLLDLL